MLDDFAGGPGRAVVTVAGVTYTATEPDFCFVQGDDVTFEGVAEGSDGSTGWVSVSRTVDTLEELLEYFDEDMAENLVDENGIAEDVSVAIEVGKDELFSVGPDDQPSWYAGVSSTFGGDDLEWSLDGGTLTGRGQIPDGNGVAVDFGETAPIEFEVSCG